MLCFVSKEECLSGVEHFKTELFDLLVLLAVSCVNSSVISYHDIISLTEEMGENNKASKKSNKNC